MVLAIEIKGTGDSSFREINDLSLRSLCLTIKNNEREKCLPTYSASGFPLSLFLNTSIILHRHARPHHVTVERRRFVLLHQYGLDEDAHLAHVVTKFCGERQPVPFYLWNDNGHVDIAPRVGIALGVGAVHIDLRFGGEAGSYHSFVVSDELEGLVSGESLWSIHCRICLVLSKM